jgi:hypothetical protein
LKFSIKVSGVSKKDSERSKGAFLLKLLLHFQAGRVFSGNFSDPFPDDNPGYVAAGSSVFPQGPSVSPESSVPGNSFISDSIPLLSEGNISSFTLSAVIPSSEKTNVNMVSPDNSSEVYSTGYKIKSLNDFFSSLSENLSSLKVEVSELSNFVHENLNSEIEKLNMELRSLKDQENTRSECVKKLESRIEIIEDQNRFTFGSIRIPLEISGIAGSSALFLTNFLVWSDRWDIIRSPYFSAGLAVLMAGAVLLKFYMVNRKRNSLVDIE